MQALVKGIDNAFVRALPADTNNTNAARQVFGASYSYVAPHPSPSPSLALWSSTTAALLGLGHLKDAASVPVDDAEILTGTPLVWFVLVLFRTWAGQLGALLPLPVAAYLCGGMLYPGCDVLHRGMARCPGDGRAVQLLELVSDGSRWEVGLKGSGRTPYSRLSSLFQTPAPSISNFDGRCTLRSCIREFLMSECFTGLGVPTCQSLSVCKTGGILCRAAPSWLRFGSFELPFANQEHDLTRQLLDYTIMTHFPHLLPAQGAPPTAAAHAAFLREVTVSSAHLVAQWQAFGWCHGVINTDNMSVHGITIGTSGYCTTAAAAHYYGPFAFMDVYDPHWTPNEEDSERSYLNSGCSTAPSLIIPLVDCLVIPQDVVEAQLAEYWPSFH
eukprot:gene4412-802_t